jgi:membrane protease subunit (stomatin/prohibitin family)
MMSDSEFGPIRLRAFGSYSFRVESNPIKFIRNVAGTDGNFTAESVTNRLRNFVINKFTNYLIESKIAVLDLAANLNEFSSELNIALKDDFSEYGIELTKFLIENISLPEVVQQALYKHTDRGGNMTTYTQKQITEQLEDVTNNPLESGKLASDIMGIGTDLSVAKPMDLQGSKSGFGLSYTSKTGEEQSNNHVEANYLQGESSYMTSQKMYYAIVSGLQQGPFSVGQMQKLVQWGQLTPNTLVWAKGMEGWLSASSVPLLSKLFGSVPPPL